MEVDVELSVSKRSTLPKAITVHIEVLLTCFSFSIILQRLRIKVGQIVTLLATIKFLAGTPRSVCVPCTCLHCKLN